MQSIKKNPPHTWYFSLNYWFLRFTVSLLALCITPPSRAIVQGRRESSGASGMSRNEGKDEPGREARGACGRGCRTLPAAGRWVRECCRGRAGGCTGCPVPWAPPQPLGCAEQPSESLLSELVSSAPGQVIPPAEELPFEEDERELLCRFASRCCVGGSTYGFARDLDLWVPTEDAAGKAPVPQHRCEGPSPRRLLVPTATAVAAALRLPARQQLGELLGCSCIY